MTHSNRNGKKAHCHLSERTAKPIVRKNPKPPGTQEQIARFVNCLYKDNDLLEVRLLPSAQSAWHQASALSQETNHFVQENEAGQNIYIGANPRKHRGKKAEDVKHARSLFADFDHLSEAKVRNRIKKKGFPPPTLMMNSGHGIHCYWRLKNPVKDMEQWTHYQKRLSLLLDSDSTVCDPPRIMRLPGFVNHKEPAAPARLIEAFPKRRYSLEEVNDLLPELPAVPGSTARTEAPVQRSGMQGNPGTMSREAKASHKRLEDRAIAYLLECPAAISGKRGHNKAFNAARAVVYGFDLGVERGLRVLLDHYNPRCQPRWSEAELRHKCEEADTVEFTRPRGWLTQNERRSGNPQEVEENEGDGESCPQSPKTLHSDLSNARQLVQHHRDDLRYVCDWKKWIIWNGQRWQIDRTDEVMRRAKNTIDRLQAEATRKEVSDE